MRRVGWPVALVPWLLPWLAVTPVELPVLWLLPQFAPVDWLTPLLVPVVVPPDVPRLSLTPVDSDSVTPCEVVCERLSVCACESVWAKESVSLRLSVWPVETPHDVPDVWLTASVSA